MMGTTVKKMTRIAILSALAVVLMLLIRFPIIPSASFLEYEPADVVILLGSFLYGPLAGLLMTGIVSFIQFATVSAGSGWVGLVMHVLATGTFVIVASLIFRRFRSVWGLAAALVAGALSMTLIMIPANLFFTVRFYGVPVETVKMMLPTAIIPFNLIKSFGNALIVFAVYKPLEKWLKP
jgi:riboflavin transporter FmnP